MTPKGGALEKMLPPFKLGLGGCFGSGQQYWSWVSLEDAVKAIEHCLIKKEIEGPVNITSPQTLTNRQIVKSLARSLHRPSFFPIPTSMLKIMFGEMAEEMFLASTKTHPQKLLSSGYTFQDANLEEFLTKLVKQV